MANVRKATRPRREIVVRPAPRGGLGDVPLRDHAEAALGAYFERLNGHRPAGLYALVMREVEEPLFRAVMRYADGNQCRAAGILGINRGTLRRKLEDYGLVK
jgi:Fis family transcriptional regulator, factor for inversion stimulation protein